MKTNSKTIKEFIDIACTIEIDGKAFTSGGAFIGTDTKTGKRGGCVYFNSKDNTCGNWDGSIKVRCYGVTKSRGNMGDMRYYFRFNYEGVTYSGRLCGADYNQLAQVREIKG